MTTFQLTNYAKVESMYMDYKAKKNRLEKDMFLLFEDGDDISCMKIFDFTDSDGVVRMLCNFIVGAAAHDLKKYFRLLHALSEKFKDEDVLLMVEVPNVTNIQHKKSNMQRPCVPLKGGCYARDSRRIN